MEDSHHGNSGRIILYEKYQGVVMLMLSIAFVNTCSANEAVQSAADAVSKEITGKTLGKLYKVRNQTESSEQREVIVKACVAGLYAIGDAKNAVKIKKDLDDGDFVSSFLDECDKCQSTGRSTQKCYKCKGTGKCQNRKCSEGMVTSPGFDGQSTTRKCSTCGGTGTCKNCKGSGGVTFTCAKCRGFKNVAQRDKAMEVCKALLKTLSMPDKETKEQDEKSVEINGECTEKDEAQAAIWTRKAAEQGHVKTKEALASYRHDTDKPTKEFVGVLHSVDVEANAVIILDIEKWCFQRKVRLDRIKLNKDRNVRQYISSRWGSGKLRVTYKNIEGGYIMGTIWAGAGSGESENEIFVEEGYATYDD